MQSKRRNSVLKLAFTNAQIARPGGISRYPSCPADRSIYVNR